MMGFQGTPARLFYDFCLEEHVPVDHMLRGIDRHLALDDLRQSLKPFYSQMGRPSVDPELMIRMLIVGYCMGIRSERRLCDEVHLNLAYRWFCGLGLDGRVPDHSTFSKNRHGRFRQSDMLRRLFETVVQRCLAEGLVDADGFAVDASLIAADANKQRSVPSKDWKPEEIKESAVRAAAVSSVSSIPAGAPGSRLVLMTIGPTECRATVDERVNSFCSPQCTRVSAITDWAQQEASVGPALCRPDFIRRRPGAWARLFASDSGAHWRSSRFENSRRLIDGRRDRGRQLLRPSMRLTDLPNCP